MKAVIESKIFSALQQPPISINQAVDIYTSPVGLSARTHALKDTFSIHWM